MNMDRRMGVIMKCVKPERLNREYICPYCTGFLAVFGDRRNDDWQCVDCGTYFTREMLSEKCLRIEIVW